MCLSPEVDAAAGLLIGATAVDAMRHVHDRRQLALAALPVVLAAHQLVEVFVWWGLDGTVSESVGQTAAYAYVLVAFALPLLVPRAVASIEPDERRRRVMERLGAIGAVVALVLLGSVILGPVTFRDGGYYVAYQAQLYHGGALTFVYVVTTLGSLMASTHRFVVLYGAVNVAAVGALVWLTMSGFISLWCAWAAVTSVVIALHLRATSLGTVVRGQPRGLAT
jgi:hypothetical protein